MLAYSAGNQGSILGKSGKIVQNMSVEHLQSELDKKVSHNGLLKKTIFS